MPEIPLSRVVSVTSADPRFPAENLLQPDAGGRWRAAAAGEKQISVVLELPGPRRIHSLQVGNDGAAFVEVLVGAAAGGDFQVLLPTAALMSPGESRAGAEPRRVRRFGPEALVKGVAGRGWDRLRLVCSQPYCQTRPFGLSFLRLFSPPEDDAPPEPPLRRLGPFTLRGEGSSPQRPPGALFYQRPPSPPASPQDPPGPSYAVATLQASAGSAPRPPKRRPSPSPAAPPRKAPPPPPSSPPPPPRSPSPPPPAPPGPILGGVVLALSGFQNPLRGQLRAAALALGASYRPDWTPDCTHLVCAFPRTPKAARARALGGLLVGPAWIWDCRRLGRRLPCGRYLLDGSASSGSEGEGPDEAPPTPRPSPQAPHPPGPAPPAAPATPTTSDPPDSDADDSGDQSESDDPYGGSTEENSDEEPLPPLPDFFQDKTFFLHGEFPAGEGRRLLRYVTAFGGTLAPYMDDSVTHVVTAQGWDPALEEARRLRPSLTFVRPRWLLLCGERQRPLPAQPFAVGPRP